MFGGNNNIIYILLIIVLVIFIIIISIYISKNKVIDNFSNICQESSEEQSIQKGIGSTTSNGTIVFPKTFHNVPLIFTQVIGNSNEPNIIYNVNIYNITQSGFSYSKNSVSLQKSEDFTITDMSEDNTSQFQWIAFG